MMTSLNPQICYPGATLPTGNRPSFAHQRALNFTNSIMAMSITDTTAITTVDLKIEAMVDPMNMGTMTVMTMRAK
jgi:hypothetical protein